MTDGRVSMDDATRALVQLGRAGIRMPFPAESRPQYRTTTTYATWRFAKALRPLVRAFWRAVLG